MSARRRRERTGDDPPGRPAQRMPLSGRDYVVRITEVGPRGGGGREWELPCSEVVLPPLRVGARAHDPDQPDVLVLRRGHTGSRELYDWWTLENDPEHRGSHNVTVAVLDDDHRAVTGWLFTGCHLRSIRYSPLDAVASPLLLETAEVTFETIALHRA